MTPSLLYRRIDPHQIQAKFLSPTTGSHIATIGNDLKFHLWSEDVSQAPNSGRRFRRISTIQSTPRVPFVSMDLKTVDHVYTTLALIDRQGLLSIYEPTDPDSFKEWTLVDVFNVCGSSPPGRGEETSFRVRWDQNATPLAYVNSLSDERTQLSLVVSVLNEVKIYRSVLAPGDSGVGISSDGASHGMTFYEALRLPRHPALIRDVQWAPFSVRGTDRIATACKDGAVRIFELGVAEAPNGQHGIEKADPSSTSSVPASTATSTSTSTSRRLPPASQRQQQQQHQSSLTSGLTGRANQNNTSNTHALSASAVPPSRAARTGHAFPFLTTVQTTTSLSNAHSDAWSLTFDGQGQVLMTNGSDGVTKLWRKSVLGGQWLVFAGQEVLDPAEDTEGEEPEEDKDGESD